MRVLSHGRPPCLITKPLCSRPWVSSAMPSSWPDLLVIKITSWPAQPCMRPKLSLSTEPGILTCFFLHRYTMSRLVTTCWSLSPAASQLCSMGSRAAVSTALRTTLSRQARRAPAVRIRSFTSKPRVNNGANYARLVPVVAASTGIALGYYLYQRGPSPVRMDLTPPKCHNCVDENVPKEEKEGDCCSMEGRGLDCCSKAEVSGNSQLSPCDF